MRTPSRPPEATTGVLSGIFVGGRSRRMAGRPKGLLPSPEPGLTVIERAISVLRQAGAGDRIVLIGEAEAYAGLALPAVPDPLPQIGPLAGLLGLLERALADGQRAALALACDLPYVTPALIERLLRVAPEAAAVVPRAAGVLQPLCARYAPAECLPVLRETLDAGERALFRVVERLAARACLLELSEQEAETLRDWDTLDDVER